MTATRIMWAAAGSPAPAKRLTEGACGTCLVCGEYSSLPGIRASDTVSDLATLTDTAAALHSDRTCQACAWCLSGKPPDTIRLWSIVYREDGETPPSNPKAVRRLGPRVWQGSAKSDPAPILAVLLDPPDGAWFAAVADSGQIHTAPFTAVQFGAGPWRVRCERELVAGSPARFGAVCHHVASLRCAGYAKDDIATLDPHPSKLVKRGVEVWRTHATPLYPYRGSGLTSLALLLLTKKELANDIRDNTRIYA